MSDSCIICGHVFKDGEGRIVNVCLPCHDAGREPTFSEASRGYEAMRDASAKLRVPIVTAVQSPGRRRHRD